MKWFYLISRFYKLSIYIKFFYFNTFLSKVFTKSRKKDKTLISYFFVYFFVLFSFYINYLDYIANNFLFIISLNWFIFSVIIFYSLIKLKFFDWNKTTLKYLWLFSIYISSFFWVLYILRNDFSIIISLVLVYWVVFNFIFHKKFENYVSLFFVFFDIIFLVYFYFFEYFYIWENKNAIFLSLSFGISFFIIFYTYFFKLKYIFSYYFYHIIAYFVNIYWIFYFFFLNSFDILNLWVILLIESWFIFLSYNKMNLLKK